MSVVSRLRLCHLYPDLLDLYGDRGNVIVLARRSSWRGIEVSIEPVTIGAALPEGCDLYYLGGGQDRDQARCAEDLLGAKAAALREAAAGGAVVFGVCGGLQLLGHEYRVGTGSVAGIGLLDLVTEAGPDRLVGEVVATSDLGPASSPPAAPLRGFENHRGRTWLGGGAQPLGIVQHGHGNNGVDAGEGARDGRVLGTYLHGPVLARNVWLADWLISEATGQRSLAALDDALEARAGPVGGAPVTDRGGRAGGGLLRRRRAASAPG